MFNLDTKASLNFECGINLVQLPSLYDHTFSDKSLNIISYTKMVCQTVEEMEELEDYISQSQIKRELPRNFAKNIIELENIIDLHFSKIEEKTIEKLAGLYKSGVEYYAGISAEKEEFFSEKLTQLFTKKQVMNVINSGVSNWTKGKSGSAHLKLLSAKFSLHLSNFQAMQISREMIREHKIDFEIMKQLVISELDFQKKLFLENILIKKRKTIKRSKKKKVSVIQSDFRRSVDIPKMFSTNINLTKNNFDKIIDEVFKQIFIRFYIKLSENAVEFTKQTLNEIYYEKVKNFLKYEEEIQQIHFLKLSEGGDDIYGPYLDLMIETLENEKSNQISEYNKIFVKLIRKMKDKILNQDINSYKTVKEVKHNLLLKLLSVLK